MSCLRWFMNGQREITDWIGEQEGKERLSWARYSEETYDVMTYNQRQEPCKWQLHMLKDSGSERKADVGTDESVGRALIGQWSLTTTMLAQASSSMPNKAGDHFEKCRIKCWYWLENAGKANPDFTPEKTTTDG